MKNTLSTKDKLELLTGKPPDKEGDTIIPRFQDPKECVFCTDKNSIFYELLRIYYKHKTGKDIQKQDKENCIHNSDEWLKHSLRTAGFIYSAFTDFGKNKITGKQTMELFHDKEAREKLLNDNYEQIRHFASWIDLCDLNSKRVKNGKPSRYGNAFDIEDDCVIQDEIIHNKLKIYYDNAVEVFRTFDNEIEVIE